MRLSPIPYLFVWLVLSAGQCFALAQIDAWGGPSALALVALLQVLKAANTVPRLNDLGRPPDDAVLALLPLVSLGLWVQLLGKSTKARRQRNLASWQSEPGALRLFIDGAATLVRYPQVMFGLALPVGVLAILADLYVVEWFLALPSQLEDGGSMLASGMLGLAGFLVLYLLLQLPKRHTASRASWYPTLFILPLGLGAVALRLGGAGAFDIGMLANTQSRTDLIPFLLGTQAMWFAFAFTFGAVMATAWAVVAADSVRGSGDVLGRIKRRWLGVGSVFGAANIAITVGMLILVPGVIYALQYAFVPIVALEEPDRSSLSYSGQSSRSVRRRLFKLLLLAFLVDLVVGVGLMVLFVLTGDAPLGSTLGMGVAWKLGQVPPGITGAPPALLAIISVLAMWIWGAARIGIARCWLLRNPVVGADEGEAA